MVVILGGKSKLNEISITGKKSNLFKGTELRPRQESLI